MTKKGKIKEVKKEEIVLPKETTHFLSTKMIYLNLLIVVGLFTFLLWQLLGNSSKNSFEIFPEEKTAFATELNLGDETLANTSFRNWLLNNVFGEKVLANLKAEELFFLLNKKYSLALANIENAWVIAIKPSKFEEKNFNEFLLSNNLDIKPYTILDLKFRGQEYFTSSLNGYLLISSNKSALYAIYETKNQKLQNIYHSEKFFLLPRQNYFKINNLLFLNPNKSFQEIASKLKLNSDLELKDIITNDAKNSDNLFGTFAVTKEKIDLNLINLSASSFQKSQTANKQTVPITNNIGCMETNLLNFSGNDFKTKWINIQKELQKGNYLSLQKLTYLFMTDLKEKTEFDLEEDLIFQANSSYCFSIDTKKNNDLTYGVAFKKDPNVNAKDLIEKLKTAFIRFAPFSKPKLRSYVLEDGTKASEWIIETSELTNTNKYKYHGAELFQTKFVEDYPFTFNYAFSNDLILINSDFENLKKMIDFYSIKTAKKSLENLNIVPINLSSILNSVLTSDINLKEKMNNLILPIRKVEISKEENYLYNVSFYY